MESVTSVRPVLIKIGGALVNNPEGLEPLWAAVRQLRERQPVAVVHGGGPQATEMARRLGHEPRIVHGRRVTTDLDLEIIHWTLRGSLNTRLVAQAIRLGVPAAGLSGADGGILRVRRRPPWEVDGETVDFGLVGDVERVEPGLLQSLLNGGYVPVIAPLGIDGEGQTYNVNADTVAYSIAAALGVETLLLAAESGGVRRDVADPDSLIREIDRPGFEAGLRDGWIQGGMRVKLQIAFDALAAGIPEVFILSPGDLLLRDNGTRVFR